MPYVLMHILKHTTPRLQSAPRYCIRGIAPLMHCRPMPAQRVLQRRDPRGTGLDEGIVMLYFVIRVYREGCRALQGPYSTADALPPGRLGRLASTPPPFQTNHGAEPATTRSRCAHLQQCRPRAGLITACHAARLVRVAVVQRRAACDRAAERRHLAINNGARVCHCALHVHFGAVYDTGWDGRASATRRMSQSRPLQHLAMIKGGAIDMLCFE